jgi:hypothetical protein
MTINFLPRISEEMAPKERLIPFTKTPSFDSNFHAIYEIEACPNTCFPGTLRPVRVAKKKQKKKNLTTAERFQYSFHPDFPSAFVMPLHSLYSCEV